MKRIGKPWVSLLLFSIAVLSSSLQAQQAGPGIVAASNAQALPANVVSFSDTVPGQPDGALTVTFALYPDQQSTTATWSETQVVQITDNKYSVLLGSTSSDGIPAAVFSADQARWLGVQVNGTEKRYLLVSVPYAMKAFEAESIGGLLPSQLVTVQQLQAALKSPTTGSGATASGPAPLSADSPPQPATDFTDNNATEVLLVTQQGTGFSIHAVSAGDAALFAENSTATGTALKAVATSTTGANVGILGQSASPAGIAGAFDNTGGGQILSLRANGNEVASVDNFGDFKATQIQALNFVGPGFGLSNIPNSATTATPSNSNSTIVARDQFGGFSAGQIQALNFVGPGFGLTNIPNSATTAISSNTNSTIVARDEFGGFSAGQIQALNFVGPGFGLTNIPNSATTATPMNFNNTIVARDQFGSFSAGQIQALNFVGPGFGLTNIPNSATTATEFNFPSTIVARDGSGGFLAGFIQASSLNVMGGTLTNSGQTDFSNGTSTSPVRAVLSANTPTSCAISRELLIKTDAVPGQQLFICNANGNGYVLVGDGTGAGVTSVGAGDGSISIGGTTAAPTVEVASGGITSDKLASGAVLGSIADGALTPAKIAGTAATLGSNNTFSGTQTMFNLNVVGLLTNTTGITTSNSVFAAGGNFTGNSNTPLVSVLNQGTGAGISVGATSTVGLLAGGTLAGIDSSSTSGVGVIASSSNSYGIRSSSTNAVGLQSIGGTIGVQAASNVVGLEADGLGLTSVAAVLNSQSLGAKLLSGRMGTLETFSLDNFGNVLSSGAFAVQYPNNPVTGTIFGYLAKLDNQGNAVLPTTSDKAGIVGVVVSGAGTTGNVEIAYSGIGFCRFDNVGHPGDYAGISTTVAGNCTDVGPSYPAEGQVIGRVLATNPNNPSLLPVTLFGAGQRDASLGTLSSINTGAGLTGGPITSSGTISVASAGVTNAMLQNSSLTVNPGTGLSGGGAVVLGGSLTLTNTGALSFNSRTGNILPAPGDYSFSQLSGTATAGQLPAGVVFNNASNTFTSNQTINGSLNVIDSAPSGGSGFSAASQNNPAAVFTSNGPTILVAGNAVRGVFNLDSAGNLNIAGAVTGTSFSGDGSALTNVNASSVGGVAGANLATTSALNTETAARQSADTTLQNNISSEAASRQSADLALQTSISAETTARQSDTSNLQASINNVSTAAAKLAASNTFTAGTQDFSAAGATLPVRALPSAQTPASCVASKELLIKTDAAAGQQLFICDASGTTWNLVGDGASGGVTSFNGRNGSVSPSSNDYSFAQISGSVAPGQMPALTGDVNSAAGSTVTNLAPSGVSAGTYTKLTVDSKGRATGGSQAGFADLVGSAGQNQLPPNVVYNNQANTFSTDQTVNGTVKAVSFSGSGAFLTFVNAAMFNGLGPDNFAQMNTANSFSKKQTMVGSSSGTAPLNIVSGATPTSPVIGDIWNTGTTIQYVDNSSNTLSLVATPQSGGTQMLKLTASLTPTNVNAQTCGEQTFTVSGVNSGDMLLGVQLATHSPGTNIAIGGWRVSSANTVAIQFCNVSRNSSTPAAGTYSLALMR